MKSKLRALLSLHEGRVPWAYWDSLGYLTIGVGHLIDPRKGGRLPEPIIDALLDWDIETAKYNLFEALPWARGLDEVRQAVLIDMTFNMGPEPFDGDGYKDWPVTVRAIKEGRWDDAANAMLDSKWARQVGRRAERLASMMRTGEWPAELKGKAGP